MNGFHWTSEVTVNYMKQHKIKIVICEFETFIITREKNVQNYL